MNQFISHFSRRQITIAVGCILALTTLILYLPTLRNGFVNFDDGGYITENPHVTPGLTKDGIVWAFKSVEGGNWHPLTWLSHMLDCQFYGVNPVGHHFGNILLHTVNTVLLFIWLLQSTRALWRSAIVAALFGWHPLHVESVAWAAERKDVLCAFFFLLTLLTYTRYTRKPDWEKYLLTLILFFCALMSKSMAVTLPFVLLLVDFWPLNRFYPTVSTTSLRSASRLILEKLPFLLLAVIVGVATFLAQKGAGAVWTETVPFPFRFGNAVISYLRYISNTFWPVDLALLYPYPLKPWPLLAVIGSLILLAAWSVLILTSWRRNPALVTGWFWFLGMLTPVIGIVVFGAQALADRYMYLPSIGLFIVIVWGTAELAMRSIAWKKIALFASVAALASCLVMTSLQLRYWQNSLSLFLHTVLATTDNYAGYVCLGEALEHAGRRDDALKVYTEAVRINPNYALSQSKLGMMLLENGHDEEAFTHLDIAAQIVPTNANLQFNLGIFLSRHNQPQEALKHFQNALRLRPDFDRAKNESEKLLAAHPELKSVP